MLLAGLLPSWDQAGLGADTASRESERAQAAKMLLEYYHAMCTPKPLVVRQGEQYQSRRRELRRKLLECTGLWPLPERLPLDVHLSAPLDHPWCTVRRVSYRLWPGVYSSGLLFAPRQLPQRPAPAVLCPHGHWADGNAHPEVQWRCLNLARLGFVTFSSTQNHYEDLYVGVSHQTLMIWNNMRALDYLESLPEVDKSRIGVAGASGGGLQTQMLVALDDRVKAATIVGLTCDFREIMFPAACHCVCNHFPNVMRFTDHPEISTLGLPAAVQYLTMNDWTKTFEQTNFPTIRSLYTAHGLADHVACKYFNTPHNYDKSKREETYRWLDRWLVGKHPADDLLEPADSHAFPVAVLTGLKADVPGNKSFGEISRLFREQRGYRAPQIATAEDWHRYRDRMKTILGQLLGEEAVLARRSSLPALPTERTEGDLFIQETACPAEGGIRVPAILVRSSKTAGKRPIVVLCSGGGKETLLAEQGPGSAVARARAGALVVLPDVRFSGVLSPAGTANEARQRQAWERNGIVWGRPVPGMTATDLRGVLDAIATWPDADMGRVSLIARKPADLGIAAIFAAALDPRFTEIDVDLDNRCFEKRTLPLVSGVLQHGDVLQWAALLADRKLTIRNLPPEAGPGAWLAKVFAAAGNPHGLQSGKTP
jgi:cephalosporin-C deacetylase-like acetyl esterase